MSGEAGSPRRGLPPAAAGIPVPSDRRFRRSDVRQVRRRNWKQLFFRSGVYGAGALIVLIVAAWLGSVLLDAAVLRVNNTVVTGRVRVPQAEVDACLKDLKDQSILRVDLEQVRLKLVASPWVQSAELWRVLPSTVHVRIVERTPIAEARFHGQLYLVDANVIIASFGPQYAEFDLPIVDGLMQNGPTGAIVNPQGSQLVQRLFAELTARPDLFDRISQVDVSDPRNAVVLLDGERAALRLGDNHFLEAFRRYEVASRAMHDQPPQEYYELRFAGDRVWTK
jgi:cell division septal protein FtsQ